MKITKDGILIFGANEIAPKVTVHRTGYFFISNGAAIRMKLSPDARLGVAVDIKRECFYLFESPDEDGVPLKVCRNRGYVIYCKTAINAIPSFFEGKKSVSVILPSNSIEGGWWRVPK